MKYLSLVCFLMIAHLAQAQTTAAFTVYGNCGMCKTKIEKAANDTKGVTKAVWDEKTKQLTVSFDEKLTSQGRVKKAIAKAGYDSDSHRATDEVYDNLHGCCKYDRPAAKVKTTKTATSDTSSGQKTIQVGGNCGMCKNRIEGAAMKVAGVKSAVWDPKNSMLTLDYESTTQLKDIEAAVAKVGHDTEHAKASPDTYKNLPGCCQYVRLNADDNE